ncbi:MAG: hypothetical protein FWG71_03460 [Synergistaceae bacterium]|nr:hypothetical protein [Synergistaceae bacterium]
MMLVKVCKKAALVLAVVTMLVLVAASDIAEAEYQVNITRSGLEVTFEGAEQRREDRNTFIVEVHYSMISSRNNSISVNAAESKLIDANDAEISMALFSHQSGGRDVARAQRLDTLQFGVHIDDQFRSSQEIVANQPYKIMVRYLVANRNVLTPTLKNATVIINDYPFVFEDVSVSQ